MNKIQYPFVNEEAKASEFRHRVNHGGWYYNNILKRWMFVCPKQFIVYDYEKDLLKDNGFYGLVVPIYKVYNIPFGNVY